MISTSPLSILQSLYNSLIQKIFPIENLHSQEFTIKAKVRETLKSCTWDLEKSTCALLLQPLMSQRLTKERVSTLSKHGSNKDND